MAKQSVFVRKTILRLKEMGATGDVVFRYSPGNGWLFSCCECQNVLLGINKKQALHRLANNGWNTLAGVDAIPNIKFDPKLKTKLITDFIVSQFRYKKQHQFTIPNVHLGYAEMDVFTMAKSGMVYEIEVKISRSDFKADFNKDLKHNSLRLDIYMVNRFYYACEPGLISKDEIPEYAGLIYVDVDSGSMTTIKQAPHLSKGKDMESYYLKKIAKKLYWKYIRERLANTDMSPNV